MEINKISKAGTLESNDIYVIIMPNEEGGIAIELESMVMLKLKIKGLLIIQ